MRIRKEDAEKVSGSSDVFALGPATHLLQQIRSEHLYSTPSNCSLDKYCCPENGPSTSKDSQNDLSTLLDNLKAKTASTDKNFSNIDGELDMLSLNADSIQRQFQTMMDLTSFSQIPDLDHAQPPTARIKKVNFVDNLPEPDNRKREESQDDDNNKLKTEDDKLKTEGDKLKTKEDKLKTEDKLKDQVDSANDKSKQKPTKDLKENTKVLRSSKTSDKSKIKRSKSRKHSVDLKSGTAEKTECKPVNQDEWKSINKALEAERTLNLYLKYTAELLVRRWGEYLTMTTEQIRQCEIDSAREAGMVEEVIEMLEDKDRYVWQLIDELHFW